MAFNFFGFKGSSEKENDPKKTEPLSSKAAEPTKPLSFDEALARQIQAKAESAALSPPTPVETTPTPKDEIVFERAQVTEEKVASVEVEPAPASVPAAVAVSVTTPTLVKEPPSNVPATVPQPAAAEGVPQAPSQEQQQTPVQVPLVAATREDVIAAYKIFLDR